MRRLVAFATGRRTKWLIVVIWLLIGAVAGPAFSKLQGVEKNDAKSFLPQSAEATRVTDIQQQLPGGDRIPTVALYVDDHGLSATERTQVARQRQQVVQGFPQARVTQVIPAPDGKAAQFTILLPTAEAKQLQDEVGRIRDIVQGFGSTRAYVTGPGGQLVDSFKAFQGIDSTLLLAAVGVVAVLLLLIYRSPVLWVVPVVSAGLAISAAEGAVYLLAKNGLVVVNGQSAGILTVLVFGAGTDYALLLVARYREELHRHADKHEAMAFGLQRAFPSIFASASTVVLGLLCLLAAEDNSLRGLGPVAAVGIVCVFIAMTTLLPALLLVFGRRLFWPFVPHPDNRVEEEAGAFGRLGRWIGRRPRAVAAVTTAVLVVMSLGLADLHLGLSQQDAFTTKVESVQGQEAYAQHFPAGGSTPTYIVTPAGTAAQAARVARGTPGVAVVQPGPQGAGYAELNVILSVPPSSDQAFNVVTTLRHRLDAVSPQALVGGNTAVQYDVAQAASHDRRLVMPLVLAVVVVVLALLLRALVAPLLLAATVVLSFAASLGVSAVVFDSLFGFAGADQSLPLIAYIFLVALGIDYNIFLMGRVHEEAKTLGTRRGTVRGLAVTGGVITSAGVVLAATFAVLTVLPLVALVEIGFVVAFGVLLDTLVVRSILVPALTLEVGPPVWWPSRLARADRADATRPGEPALR